MQLQPHHSMPRAAGRPPRLWPHPRTPPAPHPCHLDLQRARTPSSGPTSAWRRHRRRPCPSSSTRLVRTGARSRRLHGGPGQSTAGASCAAPAAASRRPWRPVAGRVMVCHSGIYVDGRPRRTARVGVHGGAARALHRHPGPAWARDVLGGWLGCSECRLGHVDRPLWATQAPGRHIATQPGRAKGNTPYAGTSHGYVESV